MKKIVGLALTSSLTQLYGQQPALVSRQKEVIVLTSILHDRIDKVLDFVSPSYLTSSLPTTYLSPINLLRLYLSTKEKKESFLPSFLLKSEGQGQAVRC